MRTFVQCFYIIQYTSSNFYFWNVFIICQQFYFRYSEEAQINIRNVCRCVHLPYCCCFIGTQLCWAKYLRFGRGNCRINFHWGWLCPPITSLQCFLYVNRYGKRIIYITKCLLNLYWFICQISFYCIRSFLTIQKVLKDIQKKPLKDIKFSNEQFLLFVNFISKTVRMILVKRREFTVFRCVKVSQLWENTHLGG